MRRRADTSHTGPAEAHEVLEVLVGLPNTIAEILDPPAAHEIGCLLAGVGGQDELVAAHVAWCWRQRSWTVLTADPAPLRGLDPDVEIEELP